MFLSISLSHQRRRPVKRLIHNTNIWPHETSITTIHTSPWNNDKKRILRERLRGLRQQICVMQLKCLEVSCERTAPMLLHLRKKTVLWGTRLSNNPRRFLYRGWRAFQDSRTGTKPLLQNQVNFLTINNTENSQSSRGRLKLLLTPSWTWILSKVVHL